MRKVISCKVIGILACCALSLNLVGCSRPPVTSAAPQATAKPKTATPRTSRDFLGAPAVAILQNVTRADTFRVENGQPKQGQPGIGGFLITYTGNRQGKGFAEKLAHILLSDKSHSVANTECIFEPFVAYRLWSKRESVEIVFCFGCNEWIISTNDVEGKQIHRTHGSFQRARKELVALTQEAFPKDNAVRRLKPSE